MPLLQSIFLVAAVPPASPAVVASAAAPRNYAADDPVNMYFLQGIWEESYMRYLQPHAGPGSFGFMGGYGGINNIHNGAQFSHMELDDQHLVSAKKIISEDLLDDEEGADAEEVGGPALGTKVRRKAKELASEHAKRIVTNKKAILEEAARKEFVCSEPR